MKHMKTCEASFNYYNIAIINHSINHSINHPITQPPRSHTSHAFQVTSAESDAVSAFHGHGAWLSNQGPMVMGCDRM